MREDVIHYAVREHLRMSGWILVAGQYPNGSDDELPPLNVVDPTLACDDSPDCRRHSMNKLVPDVVAVRGSIALIVEAKPRFDASDVQKLEVLLNDRRVDFDRAFDELRLRRGLTAIVPHSSALEPLPVVAFSGSAAGAPSDCLCLVVDHEMCVTEVGPWAERVGELVPQSLAHRVEALDWEFADADTRYLTHGIHRYSGKFIPQIAREVIELTTAEGGLIVDPYCGSGTTLLESARLGRRSVGFDLNPLAILVSRVKTTSIAPRAIDEYARKVLSRISPLAKSGEDLFAELSLDQLMTAASADPRVSDPWFAKWFPEDVLLRLVAIEQAVGLTDDPALRDLGLVALSDILRKCSRAHSGYPNVMFDRERTSVANPYSAFVERFSAITLAVQSLTDELADKPIPEVIEGDAGALTLLDACADAVVTHPPYIGSVPYAEYGVLSLRWLGHNERDVDRLLDGGQRRSKHVLDRFRTSFGQMIAESDRVLKPGGVLFMLVGCPTVFGERVEMAEMAEELAGASGLVLAATAQRTGSNRRANLMNHETALFFEKA